MTRSDERAIAALCAQMVRDACAYEPWNDEGRAVADAIDELFAESDSPEWGPWRVACHPVLPNWFNVWRRGLRDPSAKEVFMDPRTGRAAKFFRASHAYGWILTQGMKGAIK